MGKNKKSDAIKRLINLNVDYSIKTSKLEMIDEVKFILWDMQDIGIITSEQVEVLMEGIFKRNLSDDQLCI